MDTIYAPSTAHGRAGVSIVRVSGPGAFGAVQGLTGGLPDPRRAALRTVRDHDGVLLDQAVILVFPAGHSYTGEDVVELHLHGSVAIVASVLGALSRLPGLRLAEPGEFTRRALENDRLDLAQVEGLGDLVEAETEAQRRQAFRVFSGALGVRAEVWRTKLIRARALLEASIDFVEEDVPVDVRPEVLALLNEVAVQLREERAGVRTAERVRAGFEVAIVGAPNTGKSTLLNFLAGREAAITSRHAGTTRDIIEVRMDINGIPVTLLDTAGLRDSVDEVESIGIQRTRQRAEGADLRIFLLSSAADMPGLQVLADDVVAIGKGDIYHGKSFCVSGLTGQGVGEMLDMIGRALGVRVAGVGVTIRERHRVAVERAIAHIDMATAEVKIGEDRFDLGAEWLRSAVSALESLVGRVDVEHILDEIFANFCVGK